MAMVAPWPRPRRPPSAYFLWLSAKREDIAKSLGTGKGPEVSKEVRGPRGTDGGRSLGTQMYRIYTYIYIYCICIYIYVYCEWPHKDSFAPTTNLKRHSRAFPQAQKLHDDSQKVSGLAAIATGVSRRLALLQAP
jgi:hypothetical protein